MLRDTEIRPLSLTLLLAAFLAASSSLRAEPLSLTAAKDNNIYEDGLGGVNESNGLGSFLHAGRNGQGQVIRALIAFDLTGIPETAVVTSARLTLTESTPNSSHAGTVNLHRLLADWGEGSSNAASGEAGGAPASPGDATWAHRFFDIETWAQAGGDFSSEVSASQVVSPGATSTPSWSSEQLAADVQSWVEDPDANFGWVLRLADEQSAALQFHSKDNATSPLRPTLDIEYAALPGDYNGDRRVDAADYAVWRNNLDGPATALQNNIDGAPIGLAHYSTWRSAFGDSLPHLSSVQAPEPAAAGFVAIACCLFLPRWNTRND